MEGPYKILIISTLILLLMGCGNLQWPPEGQVRSVGKGRSSVNTLAVRSKSYLDIQASGVVKVKNGDTLFLLSRRYGISAQRIIEVNDLIAPYRLRRGESLILPRPWMHKVVRGESLYQISRRYGVDFYELARLNYLLPPYRINIDQKLVLPSLGTLDSPKSALVEKHIRDLPSLKRKKKPSRQKSIIGKEILQDQPLMNRKTTRLIPKYSKSITPPSVQTSGRFNWPVRGKLSSIYGSKGNGLHNDGINIVAPRGSAVRAAEGGVVAYAGNELRGFGNLLLIKHSGGWVTAYAHNESLLVKRGDKVRRGQVVAKVGASGNVVRPQLHFEVRKGKRAINPLRHLKRLRAKLIKKRSTSSLMIKSYSMLFPRRPARS